MDYAQSLEWLYGRQALGIKLGLENVHRLMAALGNPQRAFRSVHIAGTNGKGTVCMFLDGALRGAGHKVGRFTSPHLSRFTERIVVNGHEIERAAVVHWVEKLEPIVAGMDQAGVPPTFFELVTAMAFLEFQLQEVDWAVLETGMGGRLDATNVVEPDLVVITNVGMDHQAFLGDHIVDIAAEKAGIMKPGVPCVTAATDEAVIVFKATSHAQRCPMSILGDDYHLLPDINGLRLATPAGEAHYDVGLAGEHQLTNAALAVMACDALRTGGVNVPTSAVQAALANTQHAGRLETMNVSGSEWGGTEGQTVSVLLDGAHNLDGAVALRAHFARTDASGFHLIVGFNADKDWQTMMQQWAPLAASIHGVPLRSNRTLQPVEMAPLAAGVGIPFQVAADAGDAFRRAVTAGATNVVVAGSLFLVGEMRARLLGEPVDEVRGGQ